jgi:hypothetical protein
VVSAVPVAHGAGTAVLKPDTSTANSSITDSKSMALTQGKCMVPEIEIRYCDVPGTYQGLLGKKTIQGGQTGPRGRGEEITTSYLKVNHFLQNGIFLPVKVINHQLNAQCVLLYLLLLLIVM